MCATSALPFIAVLVIRYVKLWPYYSLHKGLKASVEVVGSNMWVFAQVIMTDLNTLILSPIKLIFIAWHVALKAVLMIISCTKYKK